MSPGSNKPVDRKPSNDMDLGQQSFAAGEHCSTFAGKGELDASATTTPAAASTTTVSTTATATKSVRDSPTRVQDPPPAPFRDTFWDEEDGDSVSSASPSPCHLGGSHHIAPLQGSKSYILCRCIYVVALTSIKPRAPDDARATMDVAHSSCEFFCE